MKERIRTLRKTLDLTLEKFGDRLGVGKSAISLLESGKNSVTDQMVKSICREFDVNEEWLRDGTGNMFIERLEEDETAALVQNLLDTSNPFYDSILSIMKMYDKLNDNSQKVVDDFFKSIVDDLQNKKEDR